MIINYFKTALRNFWKNKTFSTINIIGLAIGLASFWVIALYVADEISYDTYHENAKRIYRVAQRMNWKGGGLKIAPTSSPMAAALKSDYPEIEEVVRIDAGSGSITYANKKIKVPDVFICDPTFFKIFTYKFLQGDKGNALAKPKSIVLTKTLAEKLFGTIETAINRTILIDDTPTLVTGVIADVPGNSQFSFSALKPFTTSLDDDWTRSYLYTYILLKNNTNINTLRAKLPAFYKNHLKESLGEMDYQMELQPLLSIHLHSNLDYELGPNGNISNIYIFCLVASLILLISFINYANLSAVQSLGRIREVGIRKVNGSTVNQLIGMFLTESLVLILISGAVAVFLTYLSFPFFQQLAGRPLFTWSLGVDQIIAITIGFFLIAGLLNGIYPALILSRLNAIYAIRGQIGRPLSHILTRRSLIVFQFFITISMIAGSITIYLQLRYISTKNLGFNKNQVITFHLDNPELRTKIPALKVALLRNPVIESVAASSNTIGNNSIGGGDYKVEINGSVDNKIRMAKEFMIDESFVSTLQIKMISGRNFSPDLPADKYNAVLINETLAKDAGWENPVGKKVETGKDTTGKPIYRIVIGVVADFHIYSLQHKIEPLILLLPNYLNDRDNIYVRINSKHIVEGLKYLGQIYKKFNAGNAPDYSFLDQNFENQYKAEQRQSKLLNIFTILSILISSLGLFGLITFTAQQRVREVGIRKILGATISSIVLLLSKDYLKMITIAFIISIPVSWYLMNKWLQDFAYRITLDSRIFLSAVLIVFIITLTIVSVQSFKAAAASPVKSLKND